MGIRLIIKIIGYIFLRYLLLLVVIYTTNKEAKMVQWYDLRNAEDWFYFFWMFLFFPVVETIIFTLPFSYGLKKIKENKKVWVYFLFLGLFIAEFLLGMFFTSQKIEIFNFIKVGISTVLFLLLFWKRLIGK